MNRVLKMRCNYGGAAGFRVKGDQGLQSRGGEAAHDETRAHRQEVVCEMELAGGKTDGDGIMIFSLYF